MPHYANGEPAHVGDVVKGRCYNTHGTVLGILATVKEGETCNCEVQVVLVCHGEEGRRTVWPITGRDYSDCKRLEKVL